MRPTTVGLVLAAAVAVPPAVAPPVAPPAPPGAATSPRLQEPPDSVSLHRAARDAQARFERLRIRHLPRGATGGGGACDERVGRFCSWYDEGDWAPEPESAELRALRDDLLAELDSVGRALPGDRWVAGQRVWYRAEAGAWADALEAARACGAERWWCRALEGLALHGAGRYQASRAAFAAALAAMDPEEAREWRFPEAAVDGDARALLEAAERAEERGGAGEGAPAAPPLGPALLDRFWLLADPLWLVPGNDRETAHYARWTVSRTRVGARNPYGISWGRDLEELTVRHGWELGWERGWTRPGFESDVVGHKHPEGRDFFPSGEVLADPAAAEEGELVADRTRPRSLYAPAYAPQLLPMDGQVALFPRGERLAVVATHPLPADTSWHRSHPHPRPWLDAGDQAGLPDRSGLFLAPVGPPLDEEDGRLRVDPEAARPPVPGRREGGPGTAGGPGLPAPGPAGPTRTLGPDAPAGLVLEVPAGRYVLSVERWSPEARRAGRLRRGLVWEALPPDVATLSDLLLVEAGSGEPATLEEAAAAALPRARVEPGEPFGVVWEVGGLGWRPETLRYAVAVRREGGNLLQRAGRWLGLVGEDEPLRLSWEEEGPDRPGPLLRHLELDPGALEPGRYRVLLEIAAEGRAPLAAELALEVRAAPGPGAR